MMTYELRAWVDRMLACRGCTRTEPVEVTLPAEQSCTGSVRRATKPVDACIAEIVRALNVSGKPVTIGSCCGHGVRDGEILLVDGRTLEVKQPQLLN